MPERAVPFICFSNPAALILVELERCSFPTSGLESCGEQNKNDLHEKTPSSHVRSLLDWATLCNTFLPTLVVVMSRSTRVLLLMLGDHNAHLAKRSEATIYL